MIAGDGWQSAIDEFRERHGALPLFSNEWNMPVGPRPQVPYKDCGCAACRWAREHPVEGDYAVEMHPYAGWREP